jgi:hypothetical protein
MMKLSRTITSLWWSWPQLAQELRPAERGQGYWRRLGIQLDDIPSEATFRDVAQATPEKVFRQGEQSLVTALLAYQLMPSHSTFPGESAECGVSMALNSQLLYARSRMRCRHQNADCFRPAATRTCAAQTAGHPSCDCASAACRDHCRYATARVPEANCVYYAVSNQPCADWADTEPLPAAKGKHYFGYKSKAYNVVDDRLFTLWPLSGPFVTANCDDHLRTLPGLADLRARYPHLPIGEILGDAGEGYDDILRYVYTDLHALRTIEIRHHALDQDAAACLQRGYDADGIPLCPHGYRLRSNGRNYTTRQTKWVCAQRCRLHPQPDVHHQPPATRPDCPWRTSRALLGDDVTVGLTLPDGSLRLVCDHDVTGSTWERRHRRQSYTESGMLCRLAWAWSAPPSLA